MEETKMRSEVEYSEIMVAVGMRQGPDLGAQGLEVSQEAKQAADRRQLALDSCDPLLLLLLQLSCCNLLLPPQSCST